MQITRRSFLGALAAIVIARKLPALPSPTSPTLASLALYGRRNGKTQAIVDMLRQQNEILDDMVWASDSIIAHAHRTTVRSGLPPVAWRRLSKIKDGAR